MQSNKKNLTRRFATKNRTEQKAQKIIAQNIAEQDHRALVIDRQVILKRNTIFEAKISNSRKVCL